MARLVQYKPSFRGIKKLRSSREIDRELESRARLVADYAQFNYNARQRVKGGDTIEVEVLQASSDTSEPRARVAVIARHPAAIRIEADQRILYTSLIVTGQFAKRNVKKAPLALSRRLATRAVKRAEAAERRRRRQEARDAELYAREEAV